MDGTDLLNLARNLLEPLHAALVSTALSIFGSAFTSEPYRYDAVRPTGSILQTPRFAIVFEGLEIGGGGAGYATVAGSHGLVPRFWSGYVEGEHAHTEHRILPDGTVSKDGIRRVFRLRYDPVQGTAKLDFYGRPLVIEENGGKLRIGDKLLDIPAGRQVHAGSGLDSTWLWDFAGPRPVVFVDPDGRVRMGVPEDLMKLRKQMDQSLPMGKSPGR